MSWDRIEVMGRSLDLDEGVAARVSDPYWMLGRQWQVGEFRGDNAGQPASVSLEVEAYPIQSYRAGRSGDPIAIYDREARRITDPLEQVLEAAPPARHGSARLRRAVEIAEDLVRALEALGATGVRTQLRRIDGASFDATAQALGPRAGAAMRLLVRRALDGEALLRSAQSVRRVADELDGVDRDAAERAVSAWLDANTSTENPAWVPERLEYRASVAAMTSDGEIVLDLPEHHGGHLDWYQFGLGGDTHGLGDEALVKDLVDTDPRVTVPTPVAFAGQPASRWWEFEDRRIHLGDIQSGPTDFARLAVAEFAMSYSDDWFVVPLRLPTGSLSRITRLRVVDTFGGELPNEIEHAAVRDADLAGRPFRLFELDGKRSSSRTPPWLFLAPALATSLAGESVERVVFARDEAANLAWAIEHAVEGPLGRPLDRGREWFASTGLQRDDAATGSPSRGVNDGWSYHLHAGVTPPWWIPLIPQRTRDTEQIRLRRGRMQQWEELPDGAGPSGEILEPHHPFFLEEEEVTRSGFQVERRWQYARWTDGSPRLWSQLVKGPVASIPSSGLRWDDLRTGEQD